MVLCRPLCPTGVGNCSKKVPRKYDGSLGGSWEDWCIEQSLFDPPSCYAAVSKEARRRLEARESEKALEHIAPATEERAALHREERKK